MKDAAASASASANSAKESLSNAVFDAWSDSQIKEWADKNGIKVPQGSKRNELIALARKHRDSLTGDKVLSSASSAGGKAASSASSAGGKAASSASSAGDNVGASASSAFNAATTKAGNQFAKATDDASMKAEDAFNAAIGTWSDSRLKAYLDARGVPVPQGGNKDELVKQVRLNMNKATSGYSAWTFDTWTTENLK